MDIFGTFAIVLAFLAACYAFAVGIAGIATRKPLLLKSARNAGLIVFPLVTLGVASLVFLFFTDNFSIAYVASHSNRDLPSFYKFAALWAGQEGSLLFWSWLLSIYVFLALFLNRGKHPGIDALRGGDPRRCSDFLPHPEQFCRQPVLGAGCSRRWRRVAPGCCRGWPRPHSSFAISGDGDSSSHSLSRLYRFHHSVRLRACRFARPLSWRKMDSHHAPLDHGGLGIPGRRNSAWLSLGLRGARLGRILELGPG